MVLGITFNNGPFPISKPTCSVMVSSNSYQAFVHNQQIQKHVCLL